MQKQLYIDLDEAEFMISLFSNLKKTYDIPYEENIINIVLHKKHH